MLQKARDLFNSFDLFPVPVTLKSAGDSSVRSCPSACVSFVILGFSLFYLVINVLAVTSYSTITTAIEQTVTHL